MMNALSLSQSMLFNRVFALCSMFLLALLTSVNAEAARRPAALSVKSQPVNTTIYEGQSTTFSISATSGRTITYTWYKDGVTIGTNSRSLSISNAVTANAGSYSCRVTDGATTYNCTPFSLAVNQIVRITQQPSNQMVNEGTSVSMNVTATGTGPINYQWYYNGTAISGATTSTLSFPSTLLTNAGSYYCVVSNAGSSATSTSATLSVMAVTKTTSATISWTPPSAREDGTPLASTDIAGYNLYHSDTDGASMTKIATLSAADLSYVVTELTAGTHFFAATTVDTNGVESALPTPTTTTIQF